MADYATPLIVGMGGKLAFAEPCTNVCFADKAAVRCKCTKRWASNV